VVMMAVMSPLVVTFWAYASRQQHIAASAA